MKAEVSRRHIEETKPESFEYGKNDCALWSFKYLKRLNGLDLLTKYAGKYKTWSGARASLRKQGDVSLVDYLNSHLKTIEINFAQRGDLVMYRGALGLCQGKRSYFLNKKGVQHLYTFDCKLAWRVEG